MSRQDKSTTERFARTLRELVKRPDNKVCADCKRNDPRWASWNLGVFLCIRCSGIHRGMGTHISKVKSVDLDVWTPEQMESIQKWGNRRANLYWEAHLKPGHIPPEHKMESFIRSKYESRRWALEGPLPSDPSILEDGSSHEPSAAVSSHTSPDTHPVSAISSTHTSTSSVSGRHTLMSNRQGKTHELLSSAYKPQQSVNTPISASSGSAPAQQFTPQQPQPNTAPQSDLFNLDFHAPSPSLSSNPAAPIKKDVKQDILSLFSSNPATSPSFNALGAGSQPQQSQSQLHATSMMGTTGPGVWGANSGWNSATTVPPSQGNLWGSTPAPAVQQQQNSGLFNTDEIWKSSSTPLNTNTPDLFSSPFSTAGTSQKKDDVFGDLWGGFK